MFKVYKKEIEVAGRKLNERNVNKKMLSLNKMFMYPLFHCLKTTNIYSKENNDK